MARRLQSSRGDLLQLDYVTYQTRYLLANSIVYFSQTDGIENAPDSEQLQRPPESANWQPSEYGREIGRAIKFIVADIAKEKEYQNNIPLNHDIIDTIVQYMQEHVVSWIIQMGGWEAILEYVRSRKVLLFSVLGTVVLTCLGVAVYQKYLS